MSIVLIWCASSRYFKVTKLHSFTNTVHAFVSTTQILLEKGVGTLPFCCLHISKCLKKMYMLYGVRDLICNL